MVGKRFFKQCSCTMLAKEYCLAHHGGWEMCNSKKKLKSNINQSVLLCCHGGIKRTADGTAKNKNTNNQSVHNVGQGMLDWVTSKEKYLMIKQNNPP